MSDKSDADRCDNCGERIGRDRAEVAEWRLIHNRYEGGSPSGGYDAPRWGGNFCSLACLQAGVVIELSRRAEKS